MSNKDSYCFIINCASNTHTSESVFKKYENKIKLKFPDSDFRYIRSGDSIKNLVESNLDTYSHFVACGGDGTVNSLANALINSKVILGVLPLGSGNDFAQNIGLTQNLEHDLLTLKANRIKSIDAIKVNEEYMVNTCGIGVDGLTNYYASKSFFKIGFLKYFFGGIRALYNSNPINIKYEIDGKGEKTLNNTWMVAVANGKTEGGRYKISPDSDNGDGKAEVIIVKGVSRISLMYEFIKLSCGKSFNRKIIDIKFFRKSFVLSSSVKTFTHLDGENRGQLNQLDFRMKKRALQVIVGT